MEVLGTATARVRVRPTRIAYLVRPGHRGDLLWAVEHASTEWGGYSDPILPVFRGGIRAGYAQIAQILRPDVVAYRSEGTPHAVAARIADQLGAGLAPDSNVDRVGLHVLAAVPDSFAGSNLSVPRPGAGILDAVSLGIMPADHREHWEAADFHLQDVRSARGLLVSQLSGLSPIGVTRQQTEATAHSVIGGPLTLSVYSATVPNAIHFWNQRALEIPDGPVAGPKLVWLPAHGLRDPEVWDIVRHACMASFATPPLVLDGPDPSILREVAIGAGFIEHRDPKVSVSFPLGGGAPRDLDSRPLAFALGVDPRTWLISEREYGRPVSTLLTVTRPKTTVRVDSPVLWRARMGGNVQLAIDGVEAFHWPASSAVASLLHPNARIRKEGLTFQLLTQRTYEVAVAVPEAQEVLGALLASHGWRHAVSDKGRYAMALDGASDAADVLRSRSVLGVARALTGLRGRRAEQLIGRLVRHGAAAEEIRRALEPVVAGGVRWRRLGELASDLHLHPNQVLPALERLLACQLAFRGFALNCSTCGFKATIPLARADDFVQCPGCRSTSLLRGAPAEEPHFSYALNSLLDRALDQDCVSHVVVADWARNHLGAVLARPGANLSLGDRMREVDLLAVSREQQIVGEVKSSAKAFSRSEALRTAELAREIGAATVVLASFDEWDTQSRESLRAQLEGTHHLRIELLDAGDLLTA